MMCHIVQYLHNVFLNLHCQRGGHRFGTTADTYEYLLWYALGRPVITSKIGNWSVFVLCGWRFVFGIIMRWEGREPSYSDAITTLGNNKADSLLLLSFAKVSSTKGLLNRQTCQRMLCVFTKSPHIVGHSQYELVQA